MVLLLSTLIFTQWQQNMMLPEVNRIVTAAHPTPCPDIPPVAIKLMKMPLNSFSSLGKKEDNERSYYTPLYIPITSPPVCLSEPPRPSQLTSSLFQPVLGYSPTSSFCSSNSDLLSFFLWDREKKKKDGSATGLQKQDTHIPASGLPSCPSPEVPSPPPLSLPPPSK